MARFHSLDVVDVRKETRDAVVVTLKPKAEDAALFDFTQVLHRQLDPSQKSEVVELLWSIAYADGELDPQEEYLVRKVARLLHVTDAEFVAAKRRARTAQL